MSQRRGRLEQLVGGAATAAETVLDPAEVSLAEYVKSLKRQYPSDRAAIDAILRQVRADMVTPKNSATEFRGYFQVLGRSIDALQRWLSSAHPEHRPPSRW